jgi:periplasmic divalent cation tolerance protein
MDESIFVYVTCSSLEEARHIGKTIVEERLAACVNIFPVNSIYLWEGEVKGALEFVVIIKTLESKFDEVEKKVKEIHSYENPCIVSFKANNVSKKFLDWIGDVVSGT